MTGDAPAPGGHLEPGEEIAGHRIEAVLGRGGMGVVYRARHLALDRDRALKVLPPSLSGNARFRERFRRESRIAASLEHPNVVPVHEAGDDHGRLYLSMRLVAGRDLRELVAEGGPLDQRRAAEVVADVAAGLDAAHEAGLIHRDVKPANVLIGEGSDEGRVYLTDFGISRATGGGETITSAGEIVGTADYLSPEQIAGEEVDARADVYALACVAYFALTGRPPFERDTELATLFAHANAPRPRPSERREELAAGVDGVIARALAVDRHDRPGSAGGFAAELSAAVNGATQAETVALPRPASSRSRRAWLIAGIALLAAAGAAAAILILGGDDRSESDGDRTPRPPAAVALEREATISVDGAPKGITVGGGRAWTALLSGAGGLAPIAVGDDDAERPIDVGGPVSSVAVSAGAVWAVGEPGLIRVDAATGATETIAVGANPADVVVDASGVWVALEDEDAVVRVDPATGEVDGRVAVGDGPRALAAGDGWIWVTNIEDGSLTRIDAATVERSASSIDVGSRPADVAVGEGAVWVVNVDGGDLVRVDPGDAGRPPRVEGEPLGGLQLPRGVKAGLGAVWVVTRLDRSLHRIDPRALEIGDSIRVGADPADVALGAGSVWTADEGGSVTRVSPGQSP